MAWFITRVELHGATNNDYQLLHIAMQAWGFSRVVMSDQNVKYDLPPAEYFWDGTLTRNQVLEQAKKAANTTGCRFSVVVAETSGLSWFGLDQVQTNTLARSLSTT